MCVSPAPPPTADADPDHLSAPRTYLVLACTLFCSLSWQHFIPSLNLSDDVRPSIFHHALPLAPHADALALPPRSGRTTRPASPSRWSLSSPSRSALLSPSCARGTSFRSAGARRRSRATTTRSTRPGPRMRAGRGRTGGTSVGGATSRSSSTSAQTASASLAPLLAPLGATLGGADARDRLIPAAPTRPSSCRSASCPTRTARRGSAVRATSKRARRTT